MSRRRVRLRRGVQRASRAGPGDHAHCLRWPTRAEFTHSATRTVS